MSVMIEKVRKLRLIERSLGLKHKLKVNESGHVPLNHKEMALITVANWDLEDEIKAIDEYIAKSRAENVRQKLKLLEEYDVGLDEPLDKPFDKSLDKPLEEPVSAATPKTATKPRANKDKIK